MRNDLSAVDARAGADIDQVIAGAHHRFVVFDDEHRVALRLQLAQGVDQALVIAGVQADRGLVEHIAHADQSRADAGGQPHALQFAAAERVGGTIEREVAETDFVEKRKAIGDFSGQRGENGAVVIGDFAVTYVT